MTYYYTLRRYRLHPRKWTLRYRYVVIRTGCSSDIALELLRTELRWTLRS